MGAVLRLPTVLLVASMCAPPIAMAQSEAPPQPDAAEAERRVRAENRALLMEVWKPSIVLRC